MKSYCNKLPAYCRNMQLVNQKKKKNLDSGLQDFYEPEVSQNKSCLIKILSKK